MKHRVLCPSVRLQFIRKRRDRLYMRKIERVNLLPTACWTDLVMWQWDTVAVRWPSRHRPRPMPTISPAVPAGCAMDARNCGTCYCGKFATQRFLDEVRVEYPNWTAGVVDA